MSFAGIGISFERKNIKYIGGDLCSVTFKTVCVCPLWESIAVLVNTMFRDPGH